MDGPPFALRALSYAWLAEAALLFRVFRSFFFDMARSGGPGTGGLILIAPVALLALLLVPLCVLFALCIHQGVGIWLVKVFSGMGLGVTFFVAGPLALVLFISVAVFFYADNGLAAVGLVALPPLFGATLVVLHTAAARTWLDAPHAGSLVRFLGAAAVVAFALLVVPSWVQRKPAPPPEPLSTAERDAFSAAIRADDPAPLANPRVWVGSFYLDGLNEDGDALKLAIVSRKPKSVRALAAQKKSELWAYCYEAMRYGSPDVWTALAEERAPLSNDNGIQGALERPDFDGARYLLSAGASREKLLEAARAMEYLQDQQQKIAFLQSSK
jgi:hypothetical protein